MHKNCCTCRQTLPISEFRHDKTRRDGLTPRCVRCANVAVATTMRKQRQEVLEHLGGACCSCGYREDSRALVIDHVAGDGAAARRSGIGGGRLMREVLSDTEGRFQLLCWNCNAIKRVANDEHGARPSKRRTPPRGMPDKRCSRCSNVKPASDFYLNAAAHDGLTTYCAPCQSSYNQSSYRALRRRAIEHHSGKCKHCGYDADDRALAFDHVHGGGGVERKATSSNRRRALLNAVIGDTEGKFQLLCSNCNHLKRLENAEGAGNRLAERIVPTARLDRPDRRGSAEIRALRTEQMRKTMLELWQDPEHRAAMAERMRARLASGEVLFQRKVI